MYKEKPLTNRAAFIWAAATIVGATTCQVYIGGVQWSVAIGFAGLTATTVAANKRTLAFAAATAAATTIGIIGGDWVNDKARTKARFEQQENVLIHPTFTTAYNIL
jgi:ApbE superfamily uncharacterized protein (UPF0280 family)